MMRGQQEVRELARKMFDAVLKIDGVEVEEVSGAVAEAVEKIAVAVWDAAFEAMRAQLWDRNEGIAKEVQRLIRLVEKGRTGRVEEGSGMPSPTGRNWSDLDRQCDP